MSSCPWLPPRLQRTWERHDLDRVPAQQWTQEADMHAMIAAVMLLLITAVYAPAVDCTTFDPTQPHLPIYDLVCPRKGETDGARRVAPTPTPAPSRGWWR